MLAGRSERAHARRWIGVAVMFAGVAASVAAARRMGVDFVYMHLIGKGIVRGIDVYDLALQKRLLNVEYGVDPQPLGIMYPPNTGFVTAPLSLLPIHAGRLVWFSLLVAAVVFGSRAIISKVRPNRSEAWIVGAGFVLLMSCMRWGMTPLQCAPLVYGLFCLFLVALLEGRDGWAFVIVCVVLNLKMTLALPFVGLLLFHRRFATLSWAIAISVLFGAMGFARLGGLETLSDYRANIRAMEAIADINSPDPWFPASIARLDWIYLFYGVTRHLALARFLTGALALGAFAFIVRQAARLPSRPSVTTTAVVAMPLTYLTMLVVYHHHYDSSIAIAPLVLLALGERGVFRERWFHLTLPLLVIMAVLPVAAVQRCVLSLYGESKLGFFNLVFPLATTAAFAGSLVLLRKEAALHVLERSSDEMFVVGRRSQPPAGLPPSPEARAAMASMASYTTRAPKGVFLYRSHEDANRDRDRWTVEAMVVAHEGSL